MDKVKIGAIEYKIVEEKGLTDSSGDTKLDGRCGWHNCEIHIEKKMSLQTKQLTVWHEVIHAILIHAGVNKHDEQLINILSYGIMDVLENNPEMRNK